MARRVLMRTVTLGLTASLLLLAGCGEPERAVEMAPSEVQPQRDPAETAGRSYERNFVFTTVTGDSILLVPWLLETTTLPGTVEREARGWLNRSGTWEAFFAERWETPPTRSPARILPYGNMRIVVRENDVVDGIVYQEGSRSLELSLGSLLTEWAGPRGEVFQLLEATLYLSDQRLGGLALDMARGSSNETPPGGDWAFLTSGDSLQIVLQGDAEHDGDPPPGYRGWARLELEDLQWPSLTVEWAEINAFQPARRDVPVSWTISSPDGDLSGVLEVTSSEVQAGEGSGPVLPVDAMFEVEGTVSIDGGSFPVHGLFRHQRRR